MKNLIAFFILSISLMGCKEAEVNLQSLAGQKFVLTAINGETFRAPNAPLIEFGENSMLSGKICNAFRGPAELKDGALTLKNAAATKMMCMDGELNSLESQFFSMLTDGAALSMKNGGISLSRGGDIFTFSPAPKK